MLLQHQRHTSSATACDKKLAIQQSPLGQKAVGPTYRKFRSQHERHSLRAALYESYMRKRSVHVQRVTTIRMGGMDHSLDKTSKASIEFLLNSKAHGSPSSALSDSERLSARNQAPGHSEEKNTSDEYPVSSPGQSSEGTAQSQKGAAIHHCPHCPKEMVCKNAMEYHKLRVHHDRTADIIQFPCTFGNGCREVMGRKEHFDSHMDQHRNPSPSFKYICQVCGIRFMQPSSLKRHQGWGHDVNPQPEARGR